MQEEKEITAHLMGGLGNVLFIIATCLKNIKSSCVFIVIQIYGEMPNEEWCSVIKCLKKSTLTARIIEKAE